MSDFTQNMIYVAVVLVSALVLRGVLMLVIRRTVRALLAKEGHNASGDLGVRAQQVLARASGLSSGRHNQRVTTLGSLLRSIVDLLIVTITLLTILAIFGVPMEPLLASAGIGGVALGFGAQSLVKDYLSGIFMLAEDQFGVGDVITVGDTRGTVLEVSLRVTKLRDATGTVWYMRNGEILTVANISQGFSTAAIDIPVAIDEDAEKVTAILKGALAGMVDDEKYADVLLEDPSVLGVDSMSGGTMVMRVSVKTGPDQQWGVSREVKQRAQQAIIGAGIRGPLLYRSTQQ